MSMLRDDRNDTLADSKTVHLLSELASQLFPQEGLVIPFIPIHLGIPMHTLSCQRTGNPSRTKVFLLRFHHQVSFSDIFH